MTVYKLVVANFHSEVYLEHNNMSQFILEAIPMPGGIAEDFINCLNQLSAITCENLVFSFTVKKCCILDTLLSFHLIYKAVP